MTNQTNNIFNFSEDKLELLDLLLADEDLLESAAVPAILPRPQTNEPLPLSFAQQRLWFLEALTPGSSLFNTPLTLRLKGQLDESALAQACHALVQRHESLRTTFTAVSGIPQQIIHDNWPITLETVTVSADQLDAELQTAVQHPFDLDNGPLLRFHLLQLSENEHILLLVFHHMVFDGWSANIVVDELVALYEDFSQNRQPELPDLPIQYADYALWQREWLMGDVLQTQLDYWRAQLAGELPLLQLPTDRPRPTVKTHHGAIESIRLSPQLTAQVMALCQQTGSTPFMLLLAAFQVLLHRYTAQNDILVGTPIANRQQAELERLVGFFVNTQVLRSQVDGWQTFRQLLVQVRETATAAYDHPDVPFEKLVELLQPERNLSYDPLFQVMFTYQEVGLPERPLPNLTITPVDLDNGIAQFDLVLSVSREAEQFRCGLNYNIDLFEPETIRRMLSHWQTLLTGLVAEPDKPVGQLDMLSLTEKQQLLESWNDTAVSLPQTDFAHERFFHRVQQTPEAPALIYGQQQMSYAELNAKANQLAHMLQTRGISPESKVGIFINRSFEMVVALLAVWKAGGAYVPLDPAYPQDRLQYMITDADLSLILTDSALFKKLPVEVTAVCLDQAWDDQIDPQLTSNPTSQVTLDNLAYVIYTSGSTGRPKGVGVTHRGLVNFGLMMAEQCKISASSRVLQFASFSFDASVADFLLTLLNGAALVLANRDELLMGPSFVQLMQQQAVNVVTLPPSVLALLNPADFPALRTVISAGEACSAEIVAKWAPGRHFVNGYGPTEGTVGAVTAVLTADNPNPVIGQPLPNTQVYLLNPQLQPVPVGVAGEIHIAGLGLARGYLNRPDLTAEKFIPNPFGTNAGERLYKTGDLGRYLPDGRIEFLGRIDHQVKIRGFRIELGEVEAALRQHTAVQDALVVVRETDGGLQLVAYVVGDTEQLGDLRPFLATSLPAYMVPAAFVVLARFPQTPNGKIDRKALPAPDGHLLAAAEAFVAPQDALESQLVQIWQDVLKLPAISTDANYFELGGHSLQAVTLFAAIEKQLKVRLPVSLLFEAPTIRQLAAAMRQRGEGIAEVAPVPAILPRPQGNAPLPLSLAQQRLWFLETLTSGSSLFNTPLALRLSGQLDETALTQACQALVQRHESLRTTFTAVSGIAQQVIHDNWPVNLDKMIVSADKLDAALQTAVRQQIDMEKGPLLRFHLFHLGQTDHILLLVFHHIVFDGWSAGIVTNELAALYETIRNNRQPDLPELPIQYADYALWQRDWLTSDTLQTQIDYWQNQLSGELPLLQLPTDKPRPLVKTHNGASTSVLISPELTVQITALCQQTDSTPFMLLLAAFKALLHRYTNQEDILVGMPIANRQQAELEGLVGFFVNTLVLRSQVDGWQTFRQLLAQVRDTATSAYDHPDVPFEKLVELLHPERHLSHDPLFQVMFTYQYRDLAEWALPNLTITPVDLKNDIAQFDLDLEIFETAAGLMANFHYNVDLFDKATIARMAGHFSTLLQGAVADPEQQIGTLPLLSAAERQQLLLEWNHTDVPYEQEKTVLDRFAAQVAKMPQAIAVDTLPGTSEQSQSLTYEQLNHRANQLANTLRSMDVRPGTPVAVFLERSPNMIVALLGILKAGAAYVPIDPRYPQERIDYILQDTNADVVLTQAHISSQLNQPSAQILCLDTDWATIGQADDTELPPLVTPDHTAYLIYTSGSTGRPKGVAISHRSLCHYATVGVAYLKLSPEDTMLQFASVSFDTAVEEIFSTLVSGARLLLRNEAMISTTVGFWETCAANDVTILDLPTAYWHLLCGHLSEDAPLIPSSLRILLIGGEKASTEQIQTWRKYAPPEIQLVNSYGPTEATIVATSCILAGENAIIDINKAIIGCPIANTRVYILNSLLQPVPVGVWGELYIGGVGLAQGYLNRPVLTAVSFVPDPFSQQAGSRLYKTGDHVRYLPDGNIEFRGRLDNQVKIRGFRIELGEVEAALRQHTAVQDALVLARETDGGLQLVAYVVGNTEQLGDLRPFLAKSLPAYMVPAAFVVLARFPQTPNGKIDRKALPAPDGHLLAAAEAFVAPQDALESQLVQIWQDVLKLPAISTDANYFELGGHSLQAVTLFAAIEKQLKVRLPVSLLFEAPTIRQLAVAMRQRGEGTQWSSLVPIQPLGNKTPFFCVHGGAGHVFHYHDLAQLLGTERPFYGLQPKMDPLTHQSVYKYVKQMATHYIKEIKMVQPNGPYLLGGFCFGGLVVYQMAQQLKRTGDEVGLLVFIDPSTPQNKPATSQVVSPEVISQRLARHKYNMARLGRLARVGYILNSSKNRLMAAWHQNYRAWIKLRRKGQAKLVRYYIDWQQNVPSRFADIYFMHVISTPATYAYHPRPYPGEAILFSSTLENGGDKSLGWSDLPQEGLKMYEVQSTHLGILKRPYIDQVAAELKQHLEPFT